MENDKKRTGTGAHPYISLVPPSISKPLEKTCFVPDIVLNTAAAAAKSLQSCLTLCDPIDGSPQAPPSLGISRQGHWSGLPFPAPMHESKK